MTTLVSAGELAPNLLDLLLPEPRVDILCGAPGTGLHLGAMRQELRRTANGRVSQEQMTGFVAELLRAFGDDIDALDQGGEWEDILQIWLERLSERDARVFLARARTVYTHMVSREARTLVRAGPLGDALDEPRLELTGQTHQKTRAWCQQLIDNGVNISNEVAEVIRSSWAGEPLHPEDLYYRVLYGYFQSTLDGLDHGKDTNPMLEWLTDFQKDAYEYAKGILRRYGGVFLADVVGLGKTFIAMALLRHLMDRYGHHAVVVAPPAVLSAWESLAKEHRVELALVSIGRLDDLEKYREREVLVIDESHNFRNEGTGRYEKILEWLRPDGQASAKQVLLLSATPQNNSPTDILNQIRFFPDNYARLPFEGESLEQWFREARTEPRRLAMLLQHVVVRRTRTFIRTAYPNALIRRRLPDGQVEETPLQFPRRLSGEGQCLRYQLDEQPAGSQLFDRIYHALETMNYPLHGLFRYVLPQYSEDPRVVNLRRAGNGVRGLYKVLLLKRLESSLCAFDNSLNRLRRKMTAAIIALASGRVKIHENELAEDVADERSRRTDAFELPVRLFDRHRLSADLQEDLRQVNSLITDAAALRRSPDPKIVRLQRFFDSRHPRAHKTIVFTQFKDTAQYLWESLAGVAKLGLVTGGSSGRKRTLERFSPISSQATVADDEQIELLISTDALSEGVNLQDADTLINYDLHWNPVRLIQRAGRIDRIGSEHDEIVVASFLPERGLERNLRMEEVLRQRIDEFLQVFGEDSAILPTDEQPDLEQMVGAYSGSALADSDSVDDMDALSRHINRILQLRAEDADRYHRVTHLRPGRRAVSASSLDPVVAARVGWHWRFFKGEASKLVPLDDLAGLEAMYLHADAGSGVRPSVQAGVILQAARTAFEPEAAQFQQMRSRPRMSPLEEWVRNQLIHYRDVCAVIQRPQVDELIQWVDIGQWKTILVRSARPMRKSKVPPASVFHEVRSIALRYPVTEEDLGDPMVVGIAVPGDMD